MILWMRTYWYFFIGGILVLFFVFYRSITSQTSSKKISSFIVKKGTLQRTLSLSGKIDTKEKATLRFQVSGKLAWVGTKEGDYVQKYQVIATLDQRNVKKTLEKKLNVYLKTRWDFDQTKDDYKDVIITDKIKRIIDKAQFDLNNAIIDVELQNLSLELSTLFTPIEGIVVAVDLPFAGVSVVPTQGGFEVVNPHTVYFSVTADQIDIPRLKAGMKGEIILDAYPEKKIEAEIKTLGFTPKTGEAGTVYEAEMTLNDTNTNYQYKVGMTGDVSFVIFKKQNVLIIPSSFVKLENEKKYVWKMKRNKRIKTYITTGEEDDDNFEVVSGLSENDIIYD